MRFPIVSTLFRPRPARRTPAHTRLAVQALEGRAMPALLAPATSAAGAIRVAAGDVNGDGRDDLAVIGADKTVSVSLGNGDGTFRSANRLGTAKGDYLFGLEIVDQDRDGKLDI